MERVKKKKLSKICIGVLVRPVAISIPYLLLLLYLPFVPVASSKTMRRHCGVYFIMALVLCSLILLLHLAFQIALATLVPDFFERCSFLEKLFRHVGLIKLNRLS